MKTIKLKDASVLSFVVLVSGNPYLRGIAFGGREDSIFDLDSEVKQPHRPFLIDKKLLQDNFSVGAGDELEVSFYEKGNRSNEPVISTIEYQFIEYDDMHLQLIREFKIDLID